MNNQPTYAPISVDERIRLIEGGIIELAEDWADQARLVSQVEGITDAMYVWITNPDTTLSRQGNQDQLSRLFALIRYLVELDELVGDLKSLKKEKQKGGQTHE